jgi:hypothetical protein
LAVKSLVFVFSVAMALIPIVAGTKSKSPWSAHNPANLKKVDHGSWQNFLNKYVDSSGVDKVNRLRYEYVNSVDRKSLAEYLHNLQEVKVSNLNRTEQMAFWINLYNAKTVAVILDNYPIASIRDIRLYQDSLKTKAINKAGPWDVELLQVENRKLSLNDIEHQILRPLWKDNRVHFALNCASLGCPNLSTIAFTGKNLEGLLAKGAHDFLRSPRGASLDGDTLVLSSIFDWYGSDFGSDKAHLLEFLRTFVEPKLQVKLKNPQVHVKYQYDWKLNDALPGKGSF